MNEYYLKKEKKLRRDMEKYLAPAARAIEEKTGKPYGDILEETWSCYRKDMMEHFPYIGGDKASGTRNLTGAYVFVALGVVMLRHGATMEEWGLIATDAYRKYFEKIPGFIRHLGPKLISHPDFAVKMLRRKDEKNRKNAIINHGSFETSVKAPTEDYPVIYHVNVCPLHRFARAFGYMEFMPYICNLDYVMFESFGIPFYRERTCSSGDTCCDFKFSDTLPVVPSWPCHAVTPGDSLK